MKVKVKMSISEARAIAKTCRLQASAVGFVRMSRAVISLDDRVTFLEAQLNHIRDLRK